MNIKYHGLLSTEGRFQNTRKWLAAIIVFSLGLSIFTTFALGDAIILVLAMTVVPILMGFLIMLFAIDVYHVDRTG